MNSGYKKYMPFTPVSLPDRTWPGRRIERAPIFCAIDLRDGDHALVTPMNLQEKLEYFQFLVGLGFKEIEIGSPTAFEGEYEFLRALIEGGSIPEDVTVQVLVEANEPAVRKAFKAAHGAKNVIMHLYHPTSGLQRRADLRQDMQNLLCAAVDSAKLIRDLSAGEAGYRFEYTPETFSGTEMDFAADACRQVLDTLGASKERPVILNLTNTVETCTANTFADQVEYFVRSLSDRESVIVSVRPRNNRGTGVACAELALLAGAQRIEGTLFGNGERTGCVDLMTIAMNMYTQGVDPQIDFSRIDDVRDAYEQFTKLSVPERWPYAGRLVFTAFSTQHQVAINNALESMRSSGSPYWDIPYLPIDPADIGRKYEPVVRITSRSGRGGAAFILDRSFGYHLPKDMLPEFSTAVQLEYDKLGRDLQPEEVMALFKRDFLNIARPYSLSRAKFFEEAVAGSHENVTHFSGVLNVRGQLRQLEASGNGPVDAFFSALQKAGVEGYSFLSYHNHAISQGSDSQVVTYIQLRVPDGRCMFGAGVEHNINFASVKGILSVINRFEAGRA